MSVRRSCVHGISTAREKEEPMGTAVTVTVTVTVTVAVAVTEPTGITVKAD